MWKVLFGDVRKKLKEIEPGSIQTCVTSPPYWGLRDYGVDGQLGLEPTPEEYVQNMVEVCREVKRVLRDDGTVWLNLGDSYWNNFGGGSDTMTTGNAKAVKQRGRHNKPKSDIYKIKDLVGIPWMVAFALRADGWYLRQDIIWHKPNPMPESVTDRPTKSHEYIFLLSKSQRYFYDVEAIKEPGSIPAGTKGAKGSEERFNTDGVNSRPPEYKVYDGKRNKRSVWTVPTRPYRGAHFATFPVDLIEPCILAGSSYKACEVCGAAWERVIEKGELSNQRETHNNMVNIIPGRDKPTRMNSKNMEVLPKKTTGWQPTCTCEQNGTGKSIVLDPFVGSGTTMLAAEKHGRDSIGIELDPKCKKLIEERMDNMQANLYQLGVFE